jgi:hypothetical protein
LPHVAEKQHPAEFSTRQAAGRGAIAAAAMKVK